MGPDGVSRRCLGGGRQHGGRSLQKAAGALTESPCKRTIRHSAALSALGWCEAHSVGVAPWAWRTSYGGWEAGARPRSGAPRGHVPAAVSPGCSAMTPARWLPRCGTPANEWDRVVVAASCLATRRLVQSAAICFSCVGRGQQGSQWERRIFLESTFAVAAGRDGTAGALKRGGIAPPDYAVRWFCRQGWAPPAGSTQR